MESLNSTVMRVTNSLTLKRFNEYKPCDLDKLGESGRSEDDLYGTQNVVEIGCNLLNAVLNCLLKTK